jgi:hypothetical protein
MSNTTITAKRPRQAAAIERELFTIITTPALDKSGNRLAGRFDAHLGDRVLVRASRQPFLDGARALLREGYPPGIIIEAWRSGGSSWDLRSTIAAAAKLDVKEGPCRFVFHQEPRPERPRVRQNSKPDLCPGAPDSTSTAGGRR